VHQVPIIDWLCLSSAKEALKSLRVPGSNERRGNDSDERRREDLRKAGESRGEETRGDQGRGNQRRTGESKAELRTEKI